MSPVMGVPFLTIIIYKMKKNFFLLFAAFVAIVFASSCDQTSSEESASETIVLSVDNSTIDLDVQQAATFTVTYNGEDVTDQATIINISLGGYEELTSAEFTTFRPGTHTFFAMYNGAVSETISVLGTTETGLSDVYYRRNIIFKFTATWCTYCPNATSAINAAHILYPDRLVEIAVHSDDELEVSGVVNAWSAMVGGVSGYPTVCVDANKDYNITGTPVASNIVTQAKASLAAEPTAVGIKLQSTLDDHKLTVQVDNHIIEAGNYKIVVAFLQSGFNYEQTGTTDDSYRQNHVVRWFFTDIMSGDPLGENDGNCVVGEKIESKYVVDLDESVELTDDLLETFDIVAFIMKEYDGTYHVNNAAQVGINELCDYQYEPIVE